MSRNQETVACNVDASVVDQNPALPLRSIDRPSTSFSPEGLSSIGSKRVISDVASANSPSAYTFHDGQHVVFRNTPGHVYELYADGSPWDHSDLTVASGADKIPGALAAGIPTGYAFSDTQHVNYRGTDSHIHELYWAGGSWGHNDLTLAAGAGDVPGARAAGDPAGHTFKNTQHVNYRGADGHIYELYWEGSDWKYNDLTIASGAVHSAGALALGNPIGYSLGGSQHVVYRGQDGHIHELYWEGSDWGHNDLTVAAGAGGITAVGGPAGYTLANSQHIVFRGADSHIHELFWGGGPWSHNDLTNASGIASLKGASPVGDPSGYTLHDGQHVVYRGADNHIHELYWEGGDWAHNDLTVASGAGATTLSLAASDPYGYCLGDSQHVVYSGNDTHLYELYWAGADWSNNDLSAASGIFQTPPSVLENYDSVVAVTQNAINESLVSFLDQQKKDIALYYIKNNAGEYVPATSEESADFVFTATLDYPDYLTENLYVVELYNPDRDSQTVRYNVTFSKARFVSKSPPIDLTQASGAPWIIRFYVQLALQEAALDKLSPDIRAKVEAAVANLSPNGFAIQQLYLDLNTAVFDSYENIDGLPSNGAGILSKIIEAYLKENQKAGNILFGYSIKAVGDEPNPPTFMPTDLNFCVSPYLDGAGNHSDPGLDTLTYLIMTDHHEAPVVPPKAFGFNWVNDKDLQGTIAIRRDLFIPFLISQLSPLLKTICPNVWVRADANENVNNQRIELHDGDPQQFNVFNPPHGYQVAGLDYHSKNSDHDGGFGGTISVSADYFASCAIYLEADLVVIRGSSASKAEVQANTSTVTMPLVTYSWRVSLRLQADLASNGELNLIVADSDFASPPTVQPEDESAWDRFQRSLSGDVRTYVDNLGDLRGKVEENVRTAILPALTKALQAANHFIFPGGQNFLFKNPQFGLALDLLSNLTYLAPSENSDSTPA